MMDVVILLLMVHIIVLFATAQCMHGVGVRWRRLVGKWGVKWWRDMGFHMCANHALMPMPTWAVAAGLMEDLIEFSFYFVFILTIVILLS